MYNRMAKKTFFFQKGEPPQVDLYSIWDIHVNWGKNKIIQSTPLWIRRGHIMTCHEISWHIGAFHTCSAQGSAQKILSWHHQKDSLRNVKCYHPDVIKCHEMSFNLTWWHLITCHDMSQSDPERHDFQPGKCQIGGWASTIHCQYQCH